ncbi:zf-TFIIB domain-containing protein [Roseateles amylovorans]|uniref:Zf-TFIIB domain-containing protein n=1 Tax=Roseateles amylovorans TaxID=2978473 RepID=A0ABY6B438_9BURK|nr:zf-TFIIB domain-containing protein [Roseateles amylovorans]UXH79699.1 zf-TFIIB domain-containing protein [Roseateles amylovorans]
MTALTESPVHSRPTLPLLRSGASIDCPQCAAAMHHLRLPGHQGAHVDLDHCRPCGLVWFDAMESVHLSGLGWVQLLRELQLGLPVALHDQPAVRLTCPLCRLSLKAVHNRTRFGRFPTLECPSCCGHLHRQAGMLAERGLVRPLLPAERGALKQEQRQLLCFSCGAPSDGQGDTCSYCTAPLVMIDLPRLHHALRVRQRDEPLLSPSDGRPLAWACRGCGAPMDPARETSCGRCDHAVVVPSLIDLLPTLDALEREWRDDRALRERSRAERKASYRAPSRRDGEAPGTVMTGDAASSREEDAAQARQDKLNWAIGWALGGESDDTHGRDHDELSWRQVLVVLLIFAFFLWLFYG